MHCFPFTQLNRSLLWTGVDPLTTVLWTQKLLRFLYGSAVDHWEQIPSPPKGGVYVQHLNHYVSLSTKTDMDFDFSFSYCQTVSHKIFELKKILQNSLSVMKMGF